MLVVRVLHNLTNTVTGLECYRLGSRPTVEVPACLCCEAGIASDRPRVCPACRHEFQGNGWDGVDAHWRAHHETRMPYEAFWRSLCDDHRLPSSRETRSHGSATRI